jgi:hypothetical protein
MLTKDYGPGDEATWGPWNGDSSDPRAPDSDYMTADEAEQEAREDVLCTPDDLAEFIWDTCARKTTLVRAHRIDELALQEAPAHVLLAVIVNGTDAQANTARHLLREQMLAHDVSKFSVERRASELLAEHGEPEAIDWRAEQ